MRIRKAAMVFSPVFLCLTMGATDCQYFSSTTVPVTDATPPVTWDGVWLDGNYVALASSGVSFAYHIAPGASVFAVSSGMDDGGVSKITTGGTSGWTCCRGSICRRTTSLGVPTVTTQPGNVGDTVSNGVWTTFVVTAPAVDCGDGFTLTSYALSWATTAEDFHGNRTSGVFQSIVYP